MEFKNLALLVIISFLLFTSFTVIIQTGEAAVEDERINPKIDGPEEFFFNETVSYEVEIRGAFRSGEKIIDAEEADNWTLKTESTLEATVDPLESESATSNIFTVNVTVREEGEGALNFKAYCGKNGEVAFNEKEFQISVEKPEKTKVTVKNPSEVHIEEMKIGLYIDGEQKATQTLKDLEPGEERRGSFKWSKSGLESGEHTLEVWADYGTSENDDGFNKEKLVMDRTFQIEEETSTMLYAGIIIAAIAVSVLLFIWYKNRRRRQRRPW
ncbi:MAG: CARDB domain-containing protein [Candidatus Thermoplasmatota archaeon]